MNGRRLSGCKRLACCLSCVAIGVAGLYTGTASAGSECPHVNRVVAPVVPHGVKLVRTPAAIEARVLRALGPGSHINSVVVVRRRAEIWTELPRLGHPPQDASVGGPAWIIRAYGIFIPVTTRAGVVPRPQPHNGYVVIDDRSDVTLAYGWG